MRITAILSCIFMLIGSLFGQWPARYDGPGAGIDQASSIVLDSAGNVYVTGTSDGSGSYSDYATIKYNPAGVSQWTSRYNGPDNLYDYANGMAIDGDCIYVTGGSMNGNVYLDYLTVKYNSAGDTVWTVRYNGGTDLDDYAYAIAVDDAHNVYVTGYTTGSGTGLDLTTVKYDAAGTEQWARTYSTADDDYGLDIATDAGGYVYVTGSSGNIYFETWDYVTIKYAPAGDTVWIRRYNGTANGSDEAKAIAVDNSGNVYVTGSSAGLGSGKDYTTIKYNAAGDTVWTARYNGPGNSSELAGGIAVDYTGNVYVTGGSSGTGLDWDYATVKYTATGSQEWVRRYAGPAAAHDQASAIVLDGSGGIYVTGASTGIGSGTDYTTIQYNPSGAERWVERYNGPGNLDDAALAAAVYWDYDLYVTGESNGASGNFDYATLKYACVGVAEGVLGKAPSSRMLGRMLPNPARRAVTLELRLPSLSRVYLRVYDASGRVVQVLMDGELLGGDRAVRLDARSLNPGIYFVKLVVYSYGDARAGEHVETGKLIIVK